MTTLAATPDTTSVIRFPQRLQVTIEEQPTPQPKAGQLLVETRCTLLSTGTELAMLEAKVAPDSRWAQAMKLPVTPGYNNIGQVIAVGEGVDPQQWIGKRVASYAPHARHVVLPVEHVRLVPDGVPDEEAVFFTIAEIVMNGLRRGRLVWGEAVIVYGLGLLGQLTTRLCRIAGARPVLAVDVADTRLKHLPDDPAIIPLHSQRQNVSEAIAALTAGRGVDIAFEVTGIAELIPNEFEGLRRGGRFVMLSSPRGKCLIDFHDACNAPSYEIIGAHNSSHPPQSDMLNPWTQKRHAELFFDLLLAGEIDVSTLISHRVPYQQAPETYQMLVEDRSQAMGVVFNWGS